MDCGAVCRQTKAIPGAGGLALSRCTKKGVTEMVRVRREKAFSPQWVRVPPGNWFVPPGSNRSSGGGNKAAEASGGRGS